jgi:colicin import membrane protein
MMYFEKKTQPKTFLSRGLKFSFFLHGVILLWVLAYSVVQNVIQTEKEKNAPLPQQSIRVDIVDLPTLRVHELNKVDLTKEVSKKPLAAPKAEPVAKEAPKPKPSPTAMTLPEKKVKADESRLKALQNKIRAEAKREEILAKYKEEITAKASGKEADTRAPLAGNIVSKGGSVQGAVANEADEFTALIQSHVRRFWQAPSWAAGQDYKTRVLVKLSPSGRVLSKKVIQSSGRSDFDASALEAVEAADPFPPPPEFFRRLILQEGIECGFPE